MKTRAKSDKNKNASNADENHVISTPEKMNGALNNIYRLQRRSPVIVANNSPISRSKLSTSRPTVTSDNQDERMHLIRSALKGWNDDPKKLFTLETWKQLIKKVKKGSSDEQRFKNNDRLNRLSQVIIDQIASPSYSQAVFQLLGPKSKNKFGDFLYLCEQYEATKSDSTWNKAIGEDLEIEGILDEFVPDEGTKYEGPVLGTDELFNLSSISEDEVEVEKENVSHNKRQTRGAAKAQHSPLGMTSQSSGSTNKHSTATNNFHTKECSVNIKQIVGGSGSSVRNIFDLERHKSVDHESLEMATAGGRFIVNSPDDEIIENETPPPTPLDGTDFLSDHSIPRKRTRFSSRDPDRSPSARSRLRSESSVRTTEDPGDGFRSSRVIGDTGMIDRCANGYDYASLIEEGPDTHSGNSDDLPDLDPPEQGRDKENLPKSEHEIIRDYPKPSTAPDLKPYMFEDMEEALSRPKKDKIVSGFGLTIRQEQLAVYNKAEWLEDANIDFYLGLIKDRNNKEGSGYPKVYIFQSYFYKLLDKRGYESVQGATGKDNIFEYDLVLIPIHSDHHWVLVVINFADKTMMCYDSMDHNNEKHLKIITSYLKEEWKEKGEQKNLNAEERTEDVKSESRSPLFSMSDRDESLEDLDLGIGWQTKNLGAEEIPQQKNGRDCGVFCLQFAEYLSRRQPFDFEQRHTAYFRKRMLYETLKKTLLIL